MVDDIISLKDFKRPQIGQRYVFKDGKIVEIIRHEDCAGLGYLWSVKDIKTGKIEYLVTPSIRIRTLKVIDCGLV